MKDIIGTLNYIAPEIVQKRIYDKKVDLWSYGCVLYLMVTGHTPFQCNKLA
jgi:serine/threonine protein kinase